MEFLMLIGFGLYACLFLMLDYAIYTLGDSLADLFNADEEPFQIQMATRTLVYSLLSWFLFVEPILRELAQTKSL